jgi:hypothetical protein
MFITGQWRCYAAERAEAAQKNDKGVATTKKDGWPSLGATRLRTHGALLLKRRGAPHVALVA